MKKLPLYLLRSAMLFVLCCFAEAITAQCSFTPTISVTPTDADGIYCPGDILTLTTQSYDSYQWYYNFSNSNTGGTAWAGGTGSSIMVNASQWAVVYFYVLVTDDGCTEPSETVVWDAWNFLPPSISSSGQTNYCVGESTVISNAFPGPSLFQWYKDGMEIQGATGSSYTVTETGTYTLSAAYAECPNYWQSSGVGPSFTFSAPAVPVISEMDATLTADSGTSWQWIFNGTDIPGSTDQSHKPEADGIYEVRVMDANGCEATSAPYAYPGGPLAIELIDFSVDKNENCEALLTWEVSAASEVDSYAIQFSSDAAHFETIKTFSAAAGNKFAERLPLQQANGYFRLRIESLDGGTDFSQQKFVSNLCSNKDRFKLYPNPADELITVENAQGVTGTLQVFNPMGQLILEKSVSTESEQISIEHWPIGMYQFTIESGGAIWVEKLVKL